MLPSTRCDESTSGLSVPRQQTLVNLLSLKAEACLPERCQRLVDAGFPSLLLHPPPHWTPLLQLGSSLRLSSGLLRR